MLFSKKQQEFIMNNAQGLRNKELTKKLNNSFGSKFTVSQVKKFKNSHHISSGLKSCNLPVGSERINKGYILIKIAEPNVWKEKHRVVYESMYGNIPIGYKIVFLDGNKKNCEINNLMLVSDSEMAFINKMGYNQFVEVGVNIARLKAKIKESSKLNYLLMWRNN